MDEKDQSKHGKTSTNYEANHTKVGDVQLAIADGGHTRTQSRIPALQFKR